MLTPIWYRVQAEVIWLRHHLEDEWHDRADYADDPDSYKPVGETGRYVGRALKTELKERSDAKETA